MNLIKALLELTIPPILLPIYVTKSIIKHYREVDNNYKNLDEIKLKQ